MKNNMLLHIRGTQRYEGGEPETIELDTEAHLEGRSGTLYLSYAESALTGLEGTTTIFEIGSRSIILRRSGKVNNEMDFAVGQVHESLYDTGYGVLLISVRTRRIDDEMTLEGGSLRVVYEISIEGMGSGEIEYLLQARPME